MNKTKVVYHIDSICDKSYLGKEIIGVKLNRITEMNCESLTIDKKSVKMIEDVILASGNRNKFEDIYIISKHENGLYAGFEAGFSMTPTGSSLIFDKKLKKLCDIAHEGLNDALLIDRISAHLRAYRDFDAVINVLQNEYKTKHTVRIK